MTTVNLLLTLILFVILVYMIVSFLGMIDSYWFCKKIKISNGSNKEFEIFKGPILLVINTNKDQKNLIKSLDPFFWQFDDKIICPRFLERVLVLYCITTQIDNNDFIQIKKNIPFYRTRRLISFLSIPFYFIIAFIIRHIKILSYPLVIIWKY